MELNCKLIFIIYSVCFALLVNKTSEENATVDQQEIRTVKLIPFGGYSERRRDNGLQHEKGQPSHDWSTSDGLSRSSSITRDIDHKSQHHNSDMVVKEYAVVATPNEHSVYGCGTLLTHENHQISPWMVLVYNVDNLEKNCVASLITPQSVLSLERCFQGIRRWKKARMQFVAKFAHPIGNEFTIPVQAKRGVELRYGLAIFTLSTPIYDPYVIPICFPPDNFHIQGNYFVSDFGMASSTNTVTIHEVEEHAISDSFEPLNVIRIKASKEVLLLPGTPLLVKYKDHYVQVGIMSTTFPGKINFINLLYSKVHKWIVTDKAVKVI